MSLRLRSGKQRAGIWGRSLSSSMFAYAMLAPALITIAAVVVYPLIYVVYLSFHTFYFSAGRLATDFVGLANYLDAFTSPGFWAVLYNTIHFTFFSVGLSFVLAFIVALSLQRINKGVGFFRTTSLIPWIAPLVVTGFMWKWIFNDIYGVLNFLLVKLHLVSSPINWIGHVETAMKTVIWADVWANTPFVVVILLAGMEQVPKELYESATVDGASGLACFRYITLPVIQPFILVALLIRTIFAFRAFDIIFTLTAGGPGDATTVLGLDIYWQGIRFLNLSYASTLSVITLLITIVICIGYIMVLGKRET